MTGQPKAIASSGGSPNPSYSEGNTNTAAFSYSARSCSSETQPTNFTERRHIDPTESLVLAFARHDEL